MSWFGEFLGTGMIGSFILAPVMVWFWTYSANGDSELLVKALQAQSLFLFTPRFVLATLIGGAIAMLVLRGLRYSTSFMNLARLYEVKEIERER